VKFVPLVWAALNRNRTETALTLVALTLAFTLFAAMAALDAAYQNAIDANPPNSLSVACRFECSHGLPYGYREQIARIPGVVAVGASGRMGGYHNERSQRVSVYFVDSDFRSAYRELQLIFDDAQWQALQTNRSGLYFSRSAAARWNVKPGDSFTLATDKPTRADGSAAWIFTVLGVVKDYPDGWQGPPEMIYGNYDYLEQSLLLTLRGRANEFRVSIADAARARATTRQIDTLYLNSEVPTRSAPVRDEFEQFVSASLNMKRLSLGVAAAGLVMILFLYSNALAESVRERMPEFGMLMTLGYGHSTVAMLVIFEAALPAVLGAFLGTGVAWWADIAITAAARNGDLDLPQVAIPAVEVAVVLAVAICMALLIAFVSAIAPLQRLRRARLAEVLAQR
jgi:putative ABC transport system permease protein